MRRRQFIAGSLAALAFPHALFAAGAAYDHNMPWASC